MKKIDLKLYVFTIVGTLIGLIVMVVYNYTSFYNNMHDNLMDIGTNSLGQVKEQLEGYLTKGMNVVESTVVSVEYMMENGATSEEIESFLTYESKRYTEEIDENFTGVYGLFDEKYIDGIGWVPEPGYDPRTREWYTVAKNTPGKPVLVSPYLDAQTNTIMISISKMLRDQDSVLSLDIEMEEIQNITQDISLNGLGYGFVVDKNGLVIAHKDETEKGKYYLSDNSEMRAVVEQAFLEKQNCFKVKINGEKCTVFADTIMNDWDVILIVNDNKMIQKVRVTLTRNIVICGVISILILCFYTFTMRRIRQSMKAERESNQQVEQMNQKMVKALVRTIDAKDRYTNGHSLRVAGYAHEIARRMNKSPEEQEQIFYAGLLHDVGKIRVPEEIINKPGKLTDEEYEHIKIHPVTGYHILKDVYDDKLVATGAKFHHERYDGKGYPNGLKGENIPEIARIIGVADTYDAMASNRSYRTALPQDVVRNEIVKGKGTQFDPDIADIMLRMIDDDKDYAMRERDDKEKTILVIDDEPMNIKMIEFIMKDEPMYKVISATGGAKALEILDKNNVNLILLDIMMPELDGFETLERIREKHQVPVVFMTGNKDLEMIHKAMEQGVDDYVTKPFLPLVLKEAIHSILSN